MASSDVPYYDAAQVPSRSRAADFRDGVNPFEATLRSAYDMGAAALALDQSRQATVSLPTMDSVIASVTVASDNQSEIAHQASRLDADGAIRGLREFQKLTNVLEQRYPKYSSLVLELLATLIDKARTLTDFMKSLYIDLAGISESLSHIFFDSDVLTIRKSQLVADLYAAIMAFLVSSMKCMFRVRSGGFGSGVTSGRSPERQLEHLKKIESTSMKIQAEQLQAFRSKINEDVRDAQLWQQMTIKGQQCETRELQTSPFSVMAYIRAKHGSDEVDLIDSTLTMWLHYVAEAQDIQRLAWIAKTDQDRQNILHAASRQGYVKVVQWALDKGVNVKVLDSQRRTPLFGAVEGCHDAVIRFLVTMGASRGMNVNQVSKNGQSALDIAVAIADAKGLSTVDLLLDHHASPTEGLDGATLHLLSSAAKGSLQPDANISTLAVKDRLGYTVLHEAVSFGHLELVKKLMKFKVDINTTATVGGDSILHVLIERGCDYRKFYDSSSGRDLNNLPKLGNIHVQIAKLLLEYGVVATRTRWSDELTPQQLIREKLEKAGFGPGASQERQVLIDLSQSLQDPPLVRSQLKALQGDASIPTTDEKKKTACNHFDISVIRDLVAKRYPVGGLIYDDLSKRKPPDHAETDGDAKVRRDWRWIHLPANNKTWVKDLIRNFKARNDSMICLDWPAGLNWSRVDGFIENSFHEFRGLATHARFRRPMFMALSGSTTAAISSLAIPYFDVEILGRHCDIENGADLPNHQNEQPNSLPRLEKWKMLQDAYGDLHTPCSLDQSYYLFLRDFTLRDKTQVVLKYAKRKADGQNSLVRPKRLLMVNQVWLWRIDPRTIITSFPNRRHSNSKSELLDFILEGMLEDQPISTEQMILQILIHAIGFVDEPKINAGLDENLFDIFEQSIAHEADAETICYDELYEAQKDLVYFQERPENIQNQMENLPKWSKKYKEMYKDMGDMEIKEALAMHEEKMCNIVKEVEHLREIKDILDELKMIERVLTDQKTVVQQYEKGAHNISTEDKPTLEDLKNSLDFRISKVGRLTKDATAVQNSLNDLLDLKQKQANLIEARDTRRLANEADDRARAGQKQGQLIFLFTFITVIFTPLSFASSLLAVPSRGFPQNSEGNGVSWALWQVVTAIIVTEVTGVLIAMALMWLWTFKWREWLIDLGRPVTTATHRGILVATLLDSRFSIRDVRVVD